MATESTESTEKLKIYKDEINHKHQLIKASFALGGILRLFNRISSVDSVDSVAIKTKKQAVREI
jgi:hypothetical protein